MDDDEGLELPSVSMANEREDGEVTAPMDVEPGQQEMGDIAIGDDNGYGDGGIGDNGDDDDDDDKTSDVVPVGELATDKILHGLSSVADPQEFILKFQDENKLSSTYDKTKKIL